VVNDERGHEAGDRLLQHVASRLLECVRVTDTVARLGGDEFAILLEDSADALEVADRVVTSVRQPMPIGEVPVHTSISVGIAHHRGAPASVNGSERRETPVPLRRTQVPSTAAIAATAQRDATAALLLRHADIAMYAAKGAGKSRAVLADALSAQDSG
jgi:GGDEF domain-containing protein